MMAIFSWWLVIELFGLAALPLAWRLFRRLPSRGYPLAKALGLLLVCYVLWLGATFRLLANDAGGILAAFLLVAGLSAWLGRDAFYRDPDRRAADAAAGAPRGLAGLPLIAWLRANLALVLATELLTLVVFGAWVVFRAYSGEIAGTEKPMEFAFINGVLNSRFFPPQDPWLSGYAISYYYFGYVMVAALIRLTGVVPAVGFNLALALWYALTLSGAFGVCYDLVRLAGARAGRPGTGAGRGIRYGLLGALFAGVLGNLEGLVELAYNRSLVPLAWIQWLDVKDLTNTPPSGNWSGGFWWWWRASRVIHDKLIGSNLQVINFEVIDEFPFFSFLLGDLHPHVLALPFVLLAVGLALSLFLEASGAIARPARAEEGRETARQRASSPVLGLLAGPSASTGEGQSATLRSLLGPVAATWDLLGQATGLGGWGILLYALVLGGLSFLNTWDFPIYLVLVALAFGGGVAVRNGLRWAVLGRTAAAGLIFGVLGVLCYLPFYLGFKTQAGGLLPNLLFPTRLSQFFLMFGPFLVAAIFLLLLAGRSVPGAVLRRRFLQTLPWVFFVPILFLGLILAVALILPAGRAVAQAFLSNGEVQSALGDRSLDQVAALIVQIRLATPWTYLLLAGLVSWVVAIVWAWLESGRTTVAAAQDGAVTWPATEAQPSTRSQSDLFALLLVGVALLLTFSVEFIFLKDYFLDRMNTVFKFYYEAWILLALAAAYATSRLAERKTPAILALPGLALVGILVLGGMYYPLQATPSKANDFTGQPTLDGLAYMRQTDPADLAAIDWIRHNVPPAAIVLEAAGGSYSPEGAERISMSTGNPTLLGWDFHERQWRGDAYDRLTAGRPEALQSIYRTASAEDLRALLDRWHIDYVYVGALERQKYGLTDTTVARFDRALQLVYDKDGVKIYAR